MTLSSKNTIIVFSVAAYFAFILLFATLAYGGQSQPDAKRVKEIQVSLVQHGYSAGQNWAQTQEILRGIAKDKGWQTHRSPDARVLGCVLELGNQHFDKEICTEHDNHLDFKSEDK